MESSSSVLSDLKSAIRDVPDFPRKGILFKDITTLLADRDRFRDAIDCLAGPFKKSRVDKIVAVEARGFILGAPVAYVLGAGLVLIRKKGKLPAKCIEESYTLEYGTDTLQMHSDSIEKDERVLLVDDLLATGGTCEAALRLVEKLGGEVVGCSFLIELGFLKGRDKLADYSVTKVLAY